MENGLLTGIRKLAWPKLKERYGVQLEQLYTDLSDGQAAELHALRHSDVNRPALDTVIRAVTALSSGRQPPMSGLTLSSLIWVETPCQP